MSLVKFNFDPEDLTEFVKHVKKHCGRENYEESFAGFLYTGFDIPKIRSDLMKKSVKGFPGANINDVIVNAVVLFVMRGTNIENIKTLSSAEGRSDIEKIATTLGIKSGKDKVKNKSITLSHVAQAFPDIHLLILDTLGLGPKPLEIIRDETGVSAIRGYMMSFSACMLFKGVEATEKAITYITVCISYMQSTLIGSKEWKNDTLDNKITNLLKYARVAQRSRVLSENNITQLCLTLDTESDNIEQIWVDMKKSPILSKVTAMIEDLVSKE